MTRFLAVLALALPVVGAERENDLCAALSATYGPGETVAIRAVLKATIHGTYLTDRGCVSSLLVVLPEEIPGYRGPVKTIKDDAFSRFLTARYDHRPDAPPFEATFLGVIEAAKHSGFGYYRNQRLRLVLLSVDLENRRKVVIADPPVTGVRPNAVRRLWNWLSRRL